MLISIPLLYPMIICHHSVKTIILVTKASPKTSSNQLIAKLQLILSPTSSNPSHFNDKPNKNFTNFITKSVPINGTWSSDKWGLISLNRTLKICTGRSTFKRPWRMSCKSKGFGIRWLRKTEFIMKIFGLALAIKHKGVNNSLNSIQANKAKV